MTCDRCGHEHTGAKLEDCRAAHDLRCVCGNGRANLLGVEVLRGGTTYIKFGEERPPGRATPDRCEICGCYDTATVRVDQTGPSGIKRWLYLCLGHFVQGAKREEVRPESSGIVLLT